MIIRKTILSVLSVIAVSFAAASENLSLENFNLIENGDFETAFAPWEFASWGETGEHKIGLWDYDGMMVSKVVGKGSLIQNVSVEPNSTYQLKASIVGHVNFGVKGQDIIETYRVVDADKPTEVSFLFVTGNETTNAKVYFYASDSYMGAEIDDVTMSKQDTLDLETQNTNVLVNGGFYGSEFPWIFAPWGTPAEFIADPLAGTVHDENNSVIKVNGIGAVTQTVLVEPNADYLIKAKTYVLNDHVFIGVKGEGIIETSAKANLAGLQYGWKYISTPFSTGANAKTAEVYLYSGTNNGTGLVDDVELYRINTQQSAFSEHSIPGIIEAEDYDLGGQQVSYFDKSLDNTGGAYRNDLVDIATDSVLIDGVSDQATFITNTEPGEWTEYSVSVTPGVYDIVFTGGGEIESIPNRYSNWRVNVSIDGEEIAYADLLTDDKRSFKTVKIDNVEIKPGLTQKRVIRFSYLGNAGGVHLDKIAFQESKVTTVEPYKQVAFNGMATSLPGKIQPYEYDRVESIATGEDIDGERIAHYQADRNSILTPNQSGMWVEYTVSFKDVNKSRFWTAKLNGVERIGGYMELYIGSKKVAKLALNAKTPFTLPEFVQFDTPVVIRAKIIGASGIVNFTMFDFDSVEFAAEADIFTPIPARSFQQIPFASEDYMRQFPGRIRGEHFDQIIEDDVIINGNGKAYFDKTPGSIGANLRPGEDADFYLRQRYEGLRYEGLVLEVGEWVEYTSRFDDSEEYKKWLFEITYYASARGMSLDLYINDYFIAELALDRGEPLWFLKHASVDLSAQLVQRFFGKDNVIRIVAKGDEGDTLDIGFLNFRKK